MSEEPLDLSLDVEGEEGQREQKSNDNEDDDLTEEVQVERHQSEGQQVVDSHTIGREGESGGDHGSVVSLLVLQNIDIDSLCLRSLDVKGVVQVALEDDLDGQDR